MKIAFICATPYHIFNAINIKNQLFSEYDADLFIMNHMQCYKTIGEQATISGLFKHIFTIEDCPGSKNAHGTKLAWYFFRHFIAIQSGIRRTGQAFNYNTLVINCPDVVTNELLIKRVKKSIAAKVIYVEDGIATYTIDMECYPKKLSYFFRVLGLKGFKKHVDTTYFYRPNLVQTTCPNPTQLPIPTETVKEIINAVFGFRSKDDFKDKRFIFFEESFSQDGIEVNDIELFTQAVDYLNRDACILKKHPRSTSERVKAIGLDIMQGNFPWELYCLNYDFSDNVLLSISSTALLNPKLIFDCEPTLIFLYKLVTPKVAYHTQAVTKHIENVKNLYRGKNFYIPESQEELKKILSETKNERNII